MRESIAALVAACPPDGTVTVRWLGELLAAEDGVAAIVERVEGVDMTVAEVAVRYGKGRSTVRTWLARGELPGAYRLHGREWRIPVAGLVAMQQSEALRHQTAPHIGSPPSRRPSDVGEWRKHIPQSA